MLEIRAFTRDDYEALATVKNGCLEGVGAPHFAREIAERDARRAARFAFHRFLAEVDGEPVGFAEAYESWFFEGPGRWEADVGVAEPYRRRGYGRALYGHLEQTLAGEDVSILFAGAVEGTAGERFAARRGFETQVREPLTELALERFDASRFAGVRESMAGKGVQLSTATEVLASVPDVLQKWWDLQWEIQQDIPFNRPSERMPYEMFARLFQASSFDGDLWFLAHDGDALFGVTGLKRTADPAKMLTTVTGVARGHRRRGIATALKLCGVEAAQRLGVRVVATDNEENNPMLDINRRLGFTEVGAWLCLEREVASSRDDRPQD